MSDFSQKSQLLICQAIHKEFLSLRSEGLS